MTSNGDIIIKERYRIEKQIGKGGMGIVYLALDEYLKRYVALKILKSSVSSESSFSRFKNEIFSLVRLDHPNIIRIYDAGIQENIYYVMQYVEGTDAYRELKRKGKFEFSDAFHILQQIASALDYAHEKSFYHRDVKPENILFDKHENAYLVDFGISCSTNLPHDAEGFIGTVEYASPEHCEAKPITSMSDQYSLAVVAYEMITGRLPFMSKDANPVSIAVKHIRETPPDPRTINPEIKDYMAKALLRALAKSPEQRFPSCLSFVSSLSGMSSDYMPSVSTEVKIDPALLESLRTPILSKRPAKQKVKKLQLPSGEKTSSDEESGNNQISKKDTSSKQSAEQISSEGIKLQLRLKKNDTEGSDIKSPETLADKDEKSSETERKAETNTPSKENQTIQSELKELNKPTVKEEAYSAPYPPPIPASAFSSSTNSSDTNGLSELIWVNKKITNENNSEHLSAEEENKDERRDTAEEVSMAGPLSSVPNQDFKPSFGMNVINTKNGKKDGSTPYTEKNENAALKRSAEKKTSPSDVIMNLVSFIFHKKQTTASNIVQKSKKSAYSNASGEIRRLKLNRKTDGESGELSIPKTGTEQKNETAAEEPGNNTDLNKRAASVETRLNQTYDERKIVEDFLNDSEYDGNDSGSLESPKGDSNLSPSENENKSSDNIKNTSTSTNKKAQTEAEKSSLPVKKTVKGKKEIKPAEKNKIRIASYIAVFILIAAVMSLFIFSKKDYVLEGDRLFEAGKYSDAAVSYEKAAQNKKLQDRDTLYIKLAKSYDKSGNTAKACEFLEVLAAENQTVFKENGIWISSVYKKNAESFTDNSKAAIINYQRAYEANPSDSSFLTEIADRYAKQKEFSKAIDYYLEALNKSENKGGIYYSVGKMYINLDEYPECIEYFNRAVGAGYDIPPKELGTALEGVGRKLEAYEAFKKGISKDESLKVKCAALAFEFGDELYRKKSKTEKEDKKKAKKFFSEAKQYDPALVKHHAESILKKGEEMYAAKKYTEAIFNCKYAADLEPDLGKAHYRLLLARFKNGSYKEVVESADRTLKLNSANKDIVKDIKGMKFAAEKKLKPTGSIPSQGYGNSYYGGYYHYKSGKSNKRPELKYTPLRQTVPIPKIPSSRFDAPRKVQEIPSGE